MKEKYPPTRLSHHIDFDADTDDGIPEYNFNKFDTVALLIKHI